MKLREIEIKGYKSIRDSKSKIEDIFCLIGENNCGKSNILEAIDLFLSKGVTKITGDSYYKNDTGIANEIIIKCTFTELSLHEKIEFIDWIFDEKITVEKKYFIENEKTKLIHIAYVKNPTQVWLRQDFDNLNRDNVSQYPIISYLPDSGRITKDQYREARITYIEEHPDEVTWGAYEPIIEPTGLKNALEEHLPILNYVPAISDIQDETKTSGAALLSKILGVLISRISRENPVFTELEGKLSEIKGLIEGSAGRKKIEQIQELEESIKEELGIWGIDLDIRVDPPSVASIIQSSARLDVDDGILGNPKDKGHGLQRSLVFALIRVWASLGSIPEETEEGGVYHRSNFFAFEEPELYLHPQMERATYDALKKISRMDQVILCTHSPNFIDMNDYLNIGIVTKTSIEEGTKINYIQNELFEGDMKHQFNMARYFNYDRNEVFFAKKVILVEGGCEKSSIPYLARRLDVFDHKISIIDCGGKFNIKIFMEVLNQFKIPYLVIYDEDPINEDYAPGGPKENAEKYDESKRTYSENAVIDSKCDPNIGDIKTVQPNYESLIGVTKSQIDKLGKPYAAIKMYSDPAQTISEQVQRLITQIYCIPRWDRTRSCYIHPT